MQLSEPTLISRVLLEDDRHAFRQLVLSHQSGLRMFLRRVLGDAALADECAQETWLTVYQKLSGYHGGSFRAWVLTIGMRKALRTKAAEARGNRDQSAVIEGSTSLEGNEGLRMDLEKALGQLTLPERSCLHLASCEDLSHGEIAAILELPLGTVKSHLARGKEKLRLILQTERNAPHG